MNLSPFEPTHAISDHAYRLTVCGKTSWEHRVVVALCERITYYTAPPMEPSCLVCLSAYRRELIANAIGAEGT